MPEHRVSADILRETMAAVASKLDNVIVFLRRACKRLVLGSAILATSPLIVASRIGQAYGTDALFNIAAQGLALLPGLPGSFLRVAFYKGTMRGIGADVRIAFGSYFSKSTALLGNRISIGAYCILGNIELQDDILIGSRVSILSGKYEHGSAFIQLRPGEDGKTEPIRIGAGTWIGEGAIIAAEIGQNCLVSSGAVVNRSVPEASMVAGNPMRIVKIQPFRSVASDGEKVPIT